MPPEMAEYVNIPERILRMPTVQIPVPIRPYTGARSSWQSEYALRRILPKATVERLP